MNISSLNPLSSSLLDVALSEPKASYPDEILDWIADQDVDFIEDKFSFSGKDIFRFQASIKSDQTTLYSFGRAQNRKSAAIKAAAELIERVAYHRFVKSDTKLNLGLTAQNGSWQITSYTSLTDTINLSHLDEQILLSDVYEGIIF